MLTPTRLFTRLPAGLHARSSIEWRTGILAPEGEPRWTGLRGGQHLPTGEPSHDETLYRAKRGFVSLE